MVLVHEPAAPLGFYVEKLWYAEGRQGPQRRERVLPNGRFQLVIDTSGSSARLPAAAIAGMRTRCVVIESPSPRPMLGVLFRPGGARAFFDAAADEFWNRAVPLDLVWRSAAVLRAAVRATD